VYIAFFGSLSGIEKTEKGRTESEWCLHTVKCTTNCPHKNKEDSVKGPFAGAQKRVWVKKPLSVLQKASVKKKEKGEGL